MPLDVSQLSAYPTQENSEISAYQEARRALWARQAAQLADGDVESAKATLAELRQQAEEFYRAKFESERS